MWTFQKKFFFHHYQSDFNEGQQKINLIYFHRPSYETLIIGNSRTSYLNQSLIPNSEAFNLGINALDPSQYNEYIRYAQQHNSKKINQIILTLDFEHYLSDHSAITTNNLENLSQTTESFLYRYKLLFSYDTLLFSSKNIRNTLFNKFKKREKTYDQSFIADSYQKDLTSIENKVNDHVNHLKSISCEPNPLYKDTLQSIKNENQDASFSVHISPLPLPVIQAYIGNQKCFEHYKLWVKDIIDVFGHTYNFMYKNDITKNYQVNFLDATHFYPKVGNAVIFKIFNDSQAPLDDFGLLITKENYEKHMDFIEKQFLDADN